MQVFQSETLLFLWTHSEIRQFYCVLRPGCCAGAHTIGQARCTTFRTRIYNETDIDSSLATSLQSKCPGVGEDDNLSPLDTVSPYIFDNFYYRDLVNKKGLLHSDQQLYSGGSADSQTTTYSTNIAKFYSDFAGAMVNMGNISPLTGSNGEIRTNCRKTNWRIWLSKLYYFCQDMYGN